MNFRVKTIMFIFNCYLLGAYYAIGSGKALDSTWRKYSGPNPKQIQQHLGGYAPDFSLPTSQGDVFNTSTHPHNNRVLAFFCGCARCRATAKCIAQYQHAKHFPNILGVTTLSRQGIIEFQKQTGIQGLLLSDTDGYTFKAYKIADCPMLCLISHSHQLVYVSHAEMSGVQLKYDIRKICQYLKHRSNNQ